MQAVRRQTLLPMACALTLAIGAGCVQREGKRPALQSQAMLASSDAKAIFRRVGCTHCHDTARKLVGPSLVEIAARYREDSSARQVLFKGLLEGSAGKWGSAIMPPQRLTNEEARTVVDWLLTR